MWEVWTRRRLRVRRDMLDLLADMGAPPSAQAPGRVVGTPSRTPPGSWCCLLNVRTRPGGS